MGTFYVVRHAKAGSRGHWTGDDRLRPLSKKGLKQAQALVDVLKPFPIASIASSPFLRCVQTAEPLGKAHGIEVQQSESLAEGHGLEGAMRFMGDPKLDHAVLSTHGDIVWELVEELVKRHVIKPGDGGFEKGSTWVVVIESGSPVRARYLPAPSLSA
ncbi:MAG TPA: phosphoglycerate mutase family protein [Candidatus Dormibacteraeota bacterium]|nr:phosphoglycerate mutase family protein [Candidatus Dormibacteraeota bacterium]